MKQVVIAILSGLLFGAGLAISGMPESGESSRFPGYHRSLGSNPGAGYGRSIAGEYSRYPMDSQAASSKDGGLLYVALP